jgi:hypothetical protein
MKVKTVEAVSRKDSSSTLPKCLRSMSLHSRHTKLWRTALWVGVEPLFMLRFFKEQSRAESTLLHRGDEVSSAMYAIFMRLAC